MHESCMQRTSITPHLSTTPNENEPIQKKRKYTKINVLLFYYKINKLNSSTISECKKKPRQSIQWTPGYTF